MNFPSPEVLWAKLNPNWLTGYGDRDAQINQQWRSLVADRQRQLAQHSGKLESNDKKIRPLLLISEPDPSTFLASFWAALLSCWDIALANPNWGTHEWNSAIKTLQPTLIWPTRLYSSPAPLLSRSSVPKILIPTGGTTGTLKFACHTWSTLLTAAAGFCQAFPTPVNTYCVLPLYHVSGLMQVLRAWFSTGQVAIAPFKSLETAPPLIYDSKDWYISLVPTQLARLIQADKSSWLSQFQAVFLGGAPAWPALLDLATEQSIPICLSYGMTETAAMVTALHPTDFLQGMRSSGTALPHASLTIDSHNTLGQIAIRSSSIAHGYYGQSSEAFSDRCFCTDDLGYLTATGHLHITGRASSKIISGGENIFPAEVEAALRSTGQVKDVCVFGQPDDRWGEAVTAAFVPAHSEVTASSLKKALLTHSDKTSLLSRYKYPKRWISLSKIPRNAQGKLIKSALEAQIAIQSKLLMPLVTDSDADLMS